MRTVDVEQHDMKMLNKIVVLEDQIEENTSCIETQLKKQGDMARKYGDLKRQKKELGGAVKSLALEL